MNEKHEQDRWEKLTHDEKNHILYLKQKSLLETLLVRNAISRKQFDKSLHDLTVKMGETLPDGTCAKYGHEIARVCD